MVKLLILFSSLWGVLHVVTTMPQDLQTGVLMAVAQVKDTLDNGGAARVGKSFEILGAKYKNDAEIGFGDAVKHRRSVSSSDSSSSSSSSSSESDEHKRHRRSADFEDLTADIAEMYSKLHDVEALDFLYE